MIGFEVDASRLLSVSMDKHGKAELFDDYAFSTVDGVMLPDFAVPAHDETCTDLTKNTPLPMCSITNFDAIPPRCCQPIML